VVDIVLVHKEGIVVVIYNFHSLGPSLLAYLFLSGLNCDFGLLLQVASARSLQVLKGDVLDQSRILFIFGVFALLLAVDVRRAFRRIEFRLETENLAWAFSRRLMRGVAFLSGVRLKGFVFFAGNLGLGISLSRVGLVTFQGIG
jgi:hypothetical protein